MSIVINRQKNKMIRQFVSIMIGIIACSFFTGCGGSFTANQKAARTVSGQSAAGAASGQNLTEMNSDQMAETDFGVKGIFRTMKINEFILSAKKSSGHLSGSRNHFNSLGDGSYVFSSPLNYAYAYRGKPVAALYGNENDDVMAIMEDGALYYASTLILNVPVWDVIFYRSSAIILAEDGKIYKYSRERDSCQEIRSYYEDGEYKSVFDTPDLNNEVFSAICPFSADLAFKKDGGVVLLSEQGEVNAQNELIREMTDNEYWKDIKDVVVAAGGVDLHNNVNKYTLAAVTADGKVFVKGQYAEEITSLENISDIISMQSGVGPLAFLCLTADGQLTMIGDDNTEWIRKMKETVGTLPPVTGIKRHKRQEELAFFAYAEDGTVYYVYADFNNQSWDYSIKVEQTTEEGVFGPSSAHSYRLDPEGKLYGTASAIKSYRKDYDTEYPEESKTRYQLIEEAPVASAAGDNVNVLYYLELLKGKYVADLSTGFEESLSYTAEYVLLDLDGDGQKELILRDNGTTKVLTIVFGRLTQIASGGNIKAYYPEDGTFLMGNNYNDSEKLYLKTDEGNSLFDNIDNSLTKKEHNIPIEASDRQYTSWKETINEKEGMTIPEESFAPLPYTEQELADVFLQ